MAPTYWVHCRVPLLHLTRHIEMCGAQCYDLCVVAAPDCLVTQLGVQQFISKDLGTVPPTVVFRVHVLVSHM